MRWRVAILAMALLVGVGGWASRQSVSGAFGPATVTPRPLPNATRTATPAATPIAVSALAQALADQMAPQCTGMTADQIIAKTQAVVAAFQRAGGNATVEQILSIALATPNLIADVRTCEGAIESAAMLDGITGGLPLPTATPAQ